MKRFFIWFSLLFFSLPVSALDCSVCSGEIRGRYLKSSGGQIFCSRECADSVLPQCAVCRIPCRNRVLTLAGKRFCSRNCMHQMFRCMICDAGLEQIITVVLPEGKRLQLCPRCSRAPKCYFCSIPGGTNRLNDGRYMCRSCLNDAAGNAETHRIFRKVRSNLVRWYGFNGTHEIELQVVDAAELQRLSGSIYSPENSRRMSLMHYKQQVMVRRYRDGREKREVQSEKCVIYVLHTFPRKYLEDAIAHELAHDHLRHRVGEVRELADEEGFCEVVAALYNKRQNRGYLNVRKEKSPDPVYGGGFRKMWQLYQVSGSLERLLRHIR